LARLFGLLGAGASGLCRCALLLLLLSHTVLNVLELSLARRCVQLHGLLARTLARAGIGAGALAAYRQATAVPDAAVAAEVHQPLDVHGDLAAQIALDGELRDLRADGVDLVLREVLDPGVRVDARALAGGVRARPSHAIDVREPDPHVLVHRDVDAGYACH